MARSSKTKTVGANLERESATLKDVFIGNNGKFHRERSSVLNRWRAAAKGWRYVKSGSFQIKHGNMQSHSVQRDGRANISSTLCET